MRVLCWILLMTGAATAAPLAWSEAMQGLDGGAIEQIVVDPQNADRAFALNATAGVFETTDGARTWKLLPLPVANSYADLCMDPQDPQVLWVNASDAVLTSRDGGRSWAPVDAAFPHPRVSKLEFDARSGVRYIDHAGILTHKSTDRGKTWRPLSQEQFAGFALSPADPQRVYAFVRDAVSVSRDGGVTWTKLAGPEPTGSVRSLLADPKRADALVAGCEKGVFRSVDAGATWKLATGIKAIERIGSFRLTWDPVNPLRVHLGADDLVYASEDGGASFTRVSTAPGEVMYPLAIAPSRPQRMYTGARLAVIRSDDGGRTWTTHDRGLTARWNRSFAVSSQEPPVVYHVSPNGVARSSDAGRTWTSGPRVAEVPGAARLLVNRMEPRRMLLTGGERTARTTDAGATWIPVRPAPDFPVSFAAFHPYDALRAYTLSSELGGSGRARHVTRDGGATWEPVESLMLSDGLGLTPTTQTGLELCEDDEASAYLRNINAATGRPIALVWAPSNAKIRYLAWANGNLARSEDHGMTWEPRAGLKINGQLNAFAVDPDDTERLYLATDHGLALSTDGGQTASFDALGFPGNALPCRVMAVAVVPSSPRQLLAATEGRVFRATIVEPEASRPSQ